MEQNHQELLHKAIPFQDIGTDEYVQLIDCKSPKVKRFSKNEIMLLSGDAVTHMGIIISGTANAYLEHIDGSQTIMSRLRPLSVFGEVLASTRTHKSPVTVYATSDVTAAFIEYPRIFSMCEKACSAHRVFLQNMLKAVGDKYFRLFDRINILREKTLRARIMAYLYTQTDSEKEQTVTLPFTKTMLADYLLANRCALSKELRKMENDGIITVKGREIAITSS